MILIDETKEVKEYIDSQLGSLCTHGMIEFSGNTSVFKRAWNRFDICIPCPVHDEEELLNRTKEDTIEIVFEHLNQ